MSGVGQKEIEFLRENCNVPGMLTVPGAPGRGVCLWESPGLVQDVPEGEGKYALSDLWFLLFGDDEDPSDGIL